MIEIKKSEVTAEEWKEAVNELKVEGYKYQVKDRPQLWYRWENDEDDIWFLENDEIVIIRKNKDSFADKIGATQEPSEPASIQPSDQEISELIDEADNIQNPSHYTHGGIETIDFIKAKLSNEEYMGFLMGNCLKYMSRCKYKESQKDDLKKAKWYLNKAIEEI